MGPAVYKTYNYLLSLVLASTLAIAASCSIHRPPDYRHERNNSTLSEQRSRIVQQAQSLLGKNRIDLNGKTFNSDCSGLVNAVFSLNGYDVIGPDPQYRQNLVRTIYKNLESKGMVYRGPEPRPGDIVFFSNTYNKFGTNRYSHTGIVETVSGDGTVAFIHNNSKGVVRDYMNLAKPHVNNINGRVINSYIRKRSRYDAPNVKYLAGELFEAYGNPFD